MTEIQDNAPQDNDHVDRIFRYAFFTFKCRPVRPRLRHLPDIDRC